MERRLNSCPATAPPNEAGLNRMPSLWKLGGLTPWNLGKLVYKKFGQDELSTRSASLSYYFLLAVFPMFLFLLSLAGLFAGADSKFRADIVSLLGRLAPGSAFALVQSVITQTLKHSSGVKLLTGILGALWAASGGMGAVVVSLNVIHGVRETRAWLKQKLLIVAMTLCLAGLILLALLLVLYGNKVGAMLQPGSFFGIAWKVLEWPVSFAAMFLSFSIVYYFGPNLDERRWYWVTPGAAVGVLLWLATSLGFRVYLHFFDNYSATYGSIGAVIILMAWLYITGFSILIGAEVNWIIENQDKGKAISEVRNRAFQQVKAS
jgi:membrane protein